MTLLTIIPGYLGLQAYFKRCKKIKNTAAAHTVIQMTALVHAVDLSQYTLHRKSEGATNIIYDDFAPVRCPSKPVSQHAQHQNGVPLLHPTPILSWFCILNVFTSKGKQNKVNIMCTNVHHSPIMQHTKEKMELITFGKKHLIVDGRKTFSCLLAVAF